MSVGKNLNGFDLKASLIPLKEIRPGGPARDGIPAIDRPRFILAKKAISVFSKSDRAIVVKKKNQIKVYPISILNWHEVVNDEIAGEKIVVTYCPLCGTGVVFSRQFNSMVRTFGVSGLLYQSDVLLYDRQTESLWSQLLRKAVTGPSKGKKLSIVESSHEPLQRALKKYPQAQVLSRKTGFRRNYQSSPYGNYDQSEEIYFPILHPDSRFHRKTWTLLIIQRGGEGKKSEQLLIPISVLDRKRLEQMIRVGGRSLKLKYDFKRNILLCPVGEGVSCMTGFWFALRTFYPRARVLGGVPK